ncbi:MAG: alpha/beta fold hydrolase [Clostridia bacterium]|nr:alpha/beta fold hydrolase [Clostridia bacterium]
MPTELKVVLIVVGVLLLLTIIVGFIHCHIEKKFIFSRRCDRTEFSLQDKPLSNFKNMQYKDFCFTSCKSILRGRFYYKENLDSNPIIIFCHGYGAGHEAYLTEIDYYINRGYTCIGFDCRGCKLSDGKITHFGASIQDLTALYNYLEEINFLQEKPLFLWGHSWGGYTALAGSTFPKVKKIIAFAPFDKPLKIIFSQSKKIIKGLANFLIPFRFVYYGLRYGKFFNISSYKTIENSKKPALIFFGEKDQIIGKVTYNFKDNVTTVFCQDKAHNPYNTTLAEQELANTITALNSAQDKKEFLNTVDYEKITEQDLDILQKTIDFLK